MIRPEAVAHLVEAYRHMGESTLADMVIANRHLDWTPEECRAALAVWQAELEAALIVSQEMRRVVEEQLRDLGADP